MKKYTHLFFDLDNTLWDFKTNSRCALESAFLKFGIQNRKVAFEQFFDAYSIQNEKLWKAYRKNEIRKKELTHSRFSLTFEQAGIQGIDPDKMNECYLEEMPKHNHLVENAKELVADLKTKGYKLFIITNGFKEVQQKKLRNSGLEPYFSKLFISEEIKTPKPSREIFEFALKSTNARKTKSLMIGDDWEVDVLGAAKFGIDAVYLCKDGEGIEHKKNSSGKIKGKIFSIENLKELKTIL